MNTTRIANIAIATLELIEDGLRKIIYTSDRLQEKLELHKLAVINNEQRKAARLALDEAEAKQVDKLAIAEAVLFEAHDQYVEKAVSRGWVA